MTDTPVDLDKHRGMKSQKATDIRRVLAEVEANAKVLRDRQGVLESQLLSSAGGVVAGSGREGALRLEPVCRRPRCRRTPITATSSPPCWRTLPGFPMRAERK